MAGFILGAFCGWFACVLAALALVSHPERKAPK